MEQKKVIKSIKIKSEIHVVQLKVKVKGSVLLVELNPDV